MVDINGWLKELVKNAQHNWRVILIRINGCYILYMVYRKGMLKIVWYNWWIDLVFEMVGNKGYLKLECEIDWWNDLKKWLVERVYIFNDRMGWQK